MFFDILRKNAGECGYQLSCSGDRISLRFPQELFGSINPIDFGESSGCEPIFDAGENLLTWEAELGACGQELTQDGDNLIFTKSLMVSTLTSIDSYMILANEGIASFSFSCNYDVSITVEANEPIKVTFEEGSGSYIQEGHLADSLGSHELYAYNFKI